MVISVPSLTVIVILLVLVVVTVKSAPAEIAAASISDATWTLLAHGYPNTSISAVVGWTSKSTPLAEIANLPGAEG